MTMLFHRFLRLCVATSRIFSRCSGLGPLVCVAGLLASALGCGPKDTEARGQLQATVVRDLAFTYVFRFQVVALKATTVDETEIQCRDFPGTYQVGNEQLQAVDAVDIEWKGQQQQAEVRLRRVPLDEPILLIARGFGQNASGAFHVVTRGCEEVKLIADETLREEESGQDPSEPIEIDVKATSGTTCSLTRGGCEVGAVCYSEISGGYCTQLGCATDDNCLPGTVCVTGGICARPCRTRSDCASGAHACTGRQGTGGCRMVCVPNSWNADSCCGSGCE